MDPTQGQDLPQRPTNILPQPTAPLDLEGMTLAERIDRVEAVVDVSLTRMATLAGRIIDEDEANLRQNREIEKNDRTIESLKKKAKENRDASLRQKETLAGLAVIVSRVKVSSDRREVALRDFQEKTTSNTLETRLEWSEESSESEETETRLDRRQSYCFLIEWICAIWKCIVKCFKC